MRTIIALALAGTLATSCANGPRLLDRGVSGNEAYVTVSNVWNDADALGAATEHCAKYGKIPRLTRSRGYAATFDCVRPSQ